MLDHFITDRPVYAQAFDFHSVWLNTAALTEVGIDDATPDPPGGTVHRDTDGKATGHVDETAMHQYVDTAVARFLTDADLDSALAAAMRGYRESGVTATTDMASMNRTWPRWCVPSGRERSRRASWGTGSSHRPAAQPTTSRRWHEQQPSPASTASASPQHVHRRDTTLGT